MIKLHNSTSIMKGLKPSTACYYIASLVRTTCACAKCGRAFPDMTNSIPTVIASTSLPFSFYHFKLNVSIAELVY